MKLTRNLVISALIGLFGLLTPQAAAQTTEGVAALVNDEPITTVDVRNRMRLIIASTGLVQLDEAALVQIRDQAIRGLVDEHLQLQAAREYEITVEEDEINQSLLDLASRNNSTIEEVIADLERSGVDISTLRHQIESETAWQIIVNGRYGSRIRISEQQIDLALERLAASASQPQFRMFEMFFELPNTASEDATIQRVIGVMDRLQQGGAFPELARQFSDAPSAANGGDIGWIVASQLQPEVATIIPQLAQEYAASGNRGALSRPIRVPGGFMIVALVGVRDGTTALQYDLSQITVPTSSVTDSTLDQMTEAMEDQPSCSALDAIAADIPGAIVTPLGSITSDALLPAIRDALAPLNAGENTGVLQSGIGLQAMIVCDRRIAGPGVPSREDLEFQLRGQQLALLSRRWLRDLRRESTIEIRD
ncbi:peptidylprolyl isomerase [Maricaulis sp.]|uniref:peptidylprolyl isomerase n=1 Tax=Maricaulis sp. TaxID=1486257 RepID=UPI00260A4613|nr:peptidylprolyl isomerase [Maricaulis sp.]